MKRPIHFGVPGQPKKLSVVNKFQLGIIVGENGIQFDLLAPQRGVKALDFESGDRGFKPESGDRGFNPESGDQGFIPGSGDQRFISESGDQGFIPRSGDQRFISESGDRGFKPESGYRGFKPESGDQGFKPESGLFDLFVIKKISFVRHDNIVRIYNADDLEEEIVTVVPDTEDRVDNDTSQGNISHDDGGVYKCSQCVYRTSDMDSLNVHVKEHLDQSNQIAPRKMSDGFYHCPECGQRTRQSGNMRRHIRQHHTIDMYECSSCNFHTRYNYQLVVHVFKHHKTKFIPKRKKGADGMYHCTQCEYSTPENGNMGRHEQRWHQNNQQPHNKDIRERQGADAKKISFVRHDNIVRIYNADDLEEELVTVVPDGEDRVDNDTSQGNISHDDDGVYKCSQCVYRTSDMASLELHVQEHPVQPNRIAPRKRAADGMYHCSVFKKISFVLHNNMIRIHDLEEELIAEPNADDRADIFRDGVYQCLQCGYRTSDIDRLELHVQEHPVQPNRIAPRKRADGGMYHCSKCDHRAKLSGQMALHEKRSHNISSDPIIATFQCSVYIDKQLESVQELNKRPQNQELNKRPQNNVEVNKRLEVIDKNIASLTFSLNDIKTALSGVRGAPGTPLEALPDPAVSGLFPVQTLEDLLELDVKLKEDPAFEASVAKIFHRINEKDLRKTTLALLHHTLGKRLAEVLCWGGSKEKVALTDFQAFTKLLLDTIFLKHNTGEKKDAVIVIQNWLKNAKRRL
ncbi:hypothetical protein M8J77_015424 [Diaphorina citri]|nr:hypothetical protein M8J77_015424 [Diaphorina citri]